MATLNKVMLIGRLTKDPEEPRVLPTKGDRGGSTVVKFRFAVGRSKKVGDTWEKDPNQLYIDCEVFSRPDSKRNLTDLVWKYAKKGDLLYIEGRLVYEEWKDANQQQRSKHKLVVDSLEFLGSRNNPNEDGGGLGGGSAGGARQTNTGRSAGAMPPPEEVGGGGDDEGGGSSGGGGDPIPF